MTEENKTKKPKILSYCKIVALLLLIPALVGFGATADTYALYLKNGDGNAAGMVLVLIFCVFLWYLPCNLLSLFFSVWGIVEARKYYAKTEDTKGKKLNFGWFIATLSVGISTCAFAVYIVISFI